ncbi:hypothetical protein ABW20_dc0100664 [Dactylellina cionopaga]|nr:hypothetical protein ABW20_dc0100664 [Dactylellina cionopaga]
MACEYYPANPIAQAASYTLEGMTEYTNFLHNVDDASSQGQLLTTITDPRQIKHAQLAKYYGAIESHILPFLKKYGYDNLHKSVHEEYNAYIDEIAKFDRAPGAKAEIAKQYVKLGTLFGAIMAIVSRDFQSEECQEDYDSDGLDEVEDSKGVVEANCGIVNGAVELTEGMSKVSLRQENINPRKEK